MPRPSDAADGDPAATAVRSRPDAARGVSESRWPTVGAVIAAMVLAGMAQVGDRALVAGLDAGEVGARIAALQSRIAEALDRMKLSKDPEPMIVVGGGSIRRPDVPGRLLGRAAPQPRGRERRRGGDRADQRRRRSDLPARRVHPGEGDRRRPGARDPARTGGRRGRADDQDRRDRGRPGRLHGGQHAAGAGEGGRRAAGEAAAAADGRR